NALAHVISVLSTGSLAAAARPEALAAAATAIRAIDALVGDPAAVSGRELAQQAASACAATYDHGKPGVQHQLAHLLGGALRRDHARLHAALLPGFAAYLRRTQPALVGELEAALGHAPLEGYLCETLRRAGAPTTVGASAHAITAALATRPELPG